MPWARDDTLRWREELPAAAEKYCQRWNLRPDGDPMTGYVSLVQPVVRSDGTPAALKLGWPHEESEHEWLALSIWDGDGAVRLYDHDAPNGVLLLERLNTDDLNGVPLDKALTTAGTLRARLVRPAPPEIRTLEANAARWARDLSSSTKLPAHIADEAAGLCRELGPTSARLLVNEDQHFENILAGEREPWLVIDPKPIAGDREYGLAPLLWNRFDPDDLWRRLDLLVEIEELDPERARAWTFVHAVANWATAGGSVTDTCAAIATTLAGR